MTTAISFQAKSASPASAAVGEHPIDWRILTRNIRDGDHGAFEYYYEQMFDLVFAEVRRTVGRDEATCLDIVQDTFVKIIRRMKVIEDRAGLVAWTRIVARTTTYDWLRRQQRMARRQREYSIAQADPTDGDACSADDLQIDDQARLAWLQTQLEQLPPDLRRMIALRYRLGWSLARIGGQFGLKPGAVDGRIRRAVEKLKQQAEDESDE